MNLNKTILIDYDTVDNLISELKKISYSNDKDFILAKVNYVVTKLENLSNKSDESIKNSIFKTMNEVKLEDPELHFNLYMLYRKLEENKITEEEAVYKYELYMKIKHFDKMMFNRK